MKNALLIIVAILVLGLIFLPLVYLSLGKIKNPLDSFGTKVSTPYASPNYIPLPANAIPTSGTNSATSSQNTNGFDLALEKTCSTQAVEMKSTDLTADFNVPQSIAHIFSGTFAFDWSLIGTWAATQPYNGKQDPHYAIDFGGGQTVEKALIVALRSIKYPTGDCMNYYNKMFNYYEDSGRFLTDTNWESLGFVLIEKGLTSINGQKYYWYTFQDNRTYSEDLGQRFVTFFNAYKNGIGYEISFMGNKKTNGSYRDIYATAAGDLTGMTLR